MNNKLDPKAVETSDDKKKRAYWMGVVVMILLSTLTVGEFFVGKFASLWWAPLISIAALKAFFIIRDYMHIGRVMSSTEHEV